MYKQIKCHYKSSYLLHITKHWKHIKQKYIFKIYVWKFKQSLPKTEKHQ
jgi:hypothetical protein